MSFREVETLFRLWSLLQHMMTTVDYPAAGINMWNGMP